MGVMSRRVLPACGCLCCFCPSLRARSRQPVKRYKKLIADTFPRPQVLETARQVTTLPVPATPVPYEEIKIQCEALVMGKQKKMSVLLSFKSQSEGSESGLSEENVNQPSGKIKQAYHHSEEEQEPFEECTKRFISQSSESEQSFRLPPSSPYDKFLKAASC